jgi:hypothetical protein
LSAQIVHLRIFTPRVPRDRDTELSIQADLLMLEKIEQWVMAEKSMCVRESRPLAPSKRLMVMEASDAMDLH